MNKNDFRNYSALLIMTVLIDRTTNPAKAAVFWADELMKELYGDDRENGAHYGDASEDCDRH